MIPAAAPLIVGATVQHTASMIFLHGLGDTGYGWAPEMQRLAKKFRSIKFILPNAPERAVTLNMGMRMPAWYDIYTLNENDEREDEVGLSESMATVKGLIDTERAAGIPPERIFLGGFSQGGAVSLFTTLMEPDFRLGGIIALSSYVPCRKLLRTMSLGPLATPIFMAHGTADNIVQYRWHQHSAAFLRGLSGAPLTVRTYEGMGHGACEAEMADLREFLEERLAATTTTTATPATATPAAAKPEL